MKVLICFVIFSAVIGNISGLQFRDCGSKTGKFTKVVVSDCDTTKDDCVLKRNTTATISIDFTLEEDVSEITTVIHGIIMGVEIKFNLKNPNACLDSGLTCPLSKGSTYSYVASVPVLRVYPKVSVEVKLELVDHNQDDIVCVLIPAKIQ